MNIFEEDYEKVSSIGRPMLEELKQYVDGDKEANLPDEPHTGAIDSFLVAIREKQL